LSTSTNHSMETCNCCLQPVTSVCQTLEEIDFERGIWSAAVCGDTERVKKILSRGGNPNAPDTSSFTALVSELNICQSVIKWQSLLNTKQEVSAFVRVLTTYELLGFLLFYCMRMHVCVLWRVGYCIVLCTCAAVMCCSYLTINKWSTSSDIDLSSMAEGWGAKNERLSPPELTRGSGECHMLPTLVQSGAPAENKLSAFLTSNRRSNDSIASDVTRNFTLGGLKPNRTYSFPSPFPPFALPFLLASFPSHPLEARPLKTARGLGEHCKLPQRGLGRSPSHHWFWDNLSLKEHI